MKFLTTNHENFEIFPDEVKLGPFENKRVNIIYTPTLLSEAQMAIITFSNTLIGEFKYEVIEPYFEILIIGKRNRTSAY
jgi:hypothetical protein